MYFLKLTAPQTGSELHVDADKINAMHRSQKLDATFLHGINLFVRETPAEITQKLWGVRPVMPRVVA
ncbi:hypothetical protein [Acetobacter cibinongensis]|uniref:Uncharacterized protein n=1 Tax=Acetobacter cibinongensis TaxID=146475 RepID=A0A1Z5YW27_9PROT|nr:hypothetical protein [Acetobacter cibinongensis]OUJ03170.1 hypothetical protein HK14_03115 [Acetobacter cibinongensis]